MKFRERAKLNDGEIKRSKLGSEFEIKDDEESASKLSMRITFLELVHINKPQVITDLLRPYNVDCLPSEGEDYCTEKELRTCCFLFHTKYPDLNYDAVLQELGYKASDWDTPLFSYFDFVLKNQKDFNELLAEAENQLLKEERDLDGDLIASTALANLIPDWKTLQTNKHSEKLVLNLRKWGLKWNLKDDWCLEFALECLQHCKIKFIDKIQFPKNFFKNREFYLAKEFDNYIETGAAWNGALMKFVRPLEKKDKFILDKCPTYSWFIYNWIDKSIHQGTFEIKGFYNPLNTQRNAFRASMEEEFLSKFCNLYSNGNYVLDRGFQSLIDSLQDFQCRLENYISNIEKIVKPFTVQAPSKESSIMNLTRHWQWLVEYQIPPTKTFTELADRNLFTRKAIELAVKDLCEKMGLLLRQSTERGRPKVKKNRIRVKK